jgi:hypothetical protein
LRLPFHSKLFAVAAISLTIFFGVPACGANWLASGAPEFDRLFQRTNGWVGADGNFAVTLTNDLTLWLFSDTFIGEVQGGYRTNATMINNSIAWQHGSNPQTGRLEFFYHQTTDGKPASLITPADGKGWFWLFDGVMEHGKLFLFLAQIERTDDKSVFGFRQKGVWLGEVSNPFAPPTQWRVTQKKIPFAQSGTDENRFFGSAVLTTDDFVYIFGTREPKGKDKKMILARAPEKGLGDFTTWQFRTRNGWTTNAAEVADLCSGVASEYSVSWLPTLKRYVLVCTENGLSEKIIARTATEPWGTWSEASVVYRCPEMARDKRIFCYAAKAHPMLTMTEGELIVTYAANSTDFSRLLNDARLYWPRFVRLRFK